MNKCFELHRLLNNLKRYDYKSINSIPINNGIYIFFGENEKYENMDRIIRVGINETGTLKGRLKKHYAKQNDTKKCLKKDSSSFRKYIGRAMISKENNVELLDYWNLKLNDDKKYKTFFNQALDNQCKVMEHQITDYLQKNMYFIILKIDDREKRKRFEDAIISTLYNSEDFTPSSEWLGNYYPDTKLSKMWLIDGIDKPKLNDAEFEELKQIIQNQI